MNPKAKKSHLYGILSAGGGFYGFPQGGNLKSGFADEEVTNAAPFEVKLARVAPKLSNGRRWVYPEPMPGHPEDIEKKFNALSRDFLLYGFPQSTQHMPALNGRPSNPETAAFMNPMSIPLYPDLAEAQKNADALKVPHVHKEIEVKEVKELFTTPEEREIVKQHKESVELRNNKIAQVLLEKGYTEDEVRTYFERQKMKDIDKIVQTSEDASTSTAEALAAMYTNIKRTGLNATGIVPLGATQNVSVSMLEKKETNGFSGLDKVELRIKKPVISDPKQLSKVQRLATKMGKLADEQDPM